MFLSTAQNVCKHGDLRLTSRDHSTSSIRGEGKVEVCMNRGRWLPVCSSSPTAPNLICRQLGFFSRGITDPY